MNEKKNLPAPPAEWHLRQSIKSILLKEKRELSRVLSIGAGRSVVIENDLSRSGVPLLCDRVDIEDCKVEGESLGAFYQCSIENMVPVKENEYDIVFANYVLEHVENMEKAATEIYRVLKEGGTFVTSIPNPAAPQYLVAKATPLWFHKLIRGAHGWETHYSFKDVDAFNTIFINAGFQVVEVMYWSYIEVYLRRFVILQQLGSLYDKMLNNLKYKRFMGDVCIVLKKG